MKHDAQQLAMDVVTSPKAAAAASTATAGMGIGAIANWIPTVDMAVATVGIITTSTLCIIQVIKLLMALRSERREIKESNLRKDILLAEREIKRAEAQEHGCKRKDDPKNQ